MTTMRTRLLAGLTALCCMGSAIGMTASAESELGFLHHYETIEETELGNAYFDYGVYNENMLAGFFIITDGTAPSEADKVTELFGQEFELYGSFAEWQPGPVVYPDGTESSMIWHSTEALEQKLAEHGENAKLYQVSVDWEFRANLLTLARKFMLEHDYVCDIITLAANVDSLGVWNGGFTGHFVNDEGEEPEAFREILLDCGLEEATETYKAWKEALDAFEASTDTSSMTPEEIAAAREAAGIMTDYEITMIGYNVAKTAMENYGDRLDSVAPSYIAHETNMHYYPNEDLWDGAGDFDGDTAVNANDASAVLAYATESGAQKGTSLDESVRMAGDVNCDGTVDAVDASYILQYAAASGAEGAADWTEILR